MFLRSTCKINTKLQEKCKVNNSELLVYRVMKISLIQDYVKFERRTDRDQVKVKVKR